MRRAQKGTFDVASCSRSDSVHRVPRGSSCNLCRQRLGHLLVSVAWRISLALRTTCIRKSSRHHSG
jgi:hypothetical protein